MPNRPSRLVAPSARPVPLIRAAVAVAGFLTAGSTAYGQLAGDLGIHDPSTLIKEGSTYYHFGTGTGVTIKTSPDRTNWSYGGKIFNAAPAWTTTAVPGYANTAWAPDVAYFNGLYHVYYSASTWGTIDSAIGLVTTPSLANPVWTDRGKVIQSDAVGHTQPETDTTAFNAIDPSVLNDSVTGRVWMSWGSYSSGIMVAEINPTTGKRIGSSVGTMVANNSGTRGWGSSIEGSALVKNGGFYYLFVNYGGCCAGVDSTYDIRVGRSTSPTGPFVDKNGVDMRDGGGTMFLDDDGKFTGPGHFSFYTEGGQDQFGYHYYNGDANGAPTYNLRNLYWTTDNWPSYAAVSGNFGGATNGNWSTATNWSGGIIPNGFGTVATFDTNAAGRYSVSLAGSNRTVGVLNLRSPTGYTIGATNGPALAFDANTGETANINVSAGSHTIAAPVGAVDALGVNVTPVDSVLTFAASVNAPQLTKYGRGTARLEGASTINGNVLARYGTLDITGSANTTGYTSIGFVVGESAAMSLRGTAVYIAGGDFNVGDTGDAVTAASGTLNLSDTAALAVNNGGLFVGSGYFANTKSVGVVNQTGGTVTVAGNFDGAFIIGGRGSALATGTYNLGGGIVQSNTNLRVGGFGTGTINQTGGTFNVNAYGAVGRFAGGTGVWDVSGGTLNQNSSDMSLIIGESGTGTLRVRDSGAVVTRTALRVGLNSGGAGTIQLDGGTLTVPSIARGNGSGRVNFNGGTLRAAGASTTFLQNLTAAVVQAGGARVDTQGFAVTIAQPLLHDVTLGTTADGGLTKSGTGTLSLTGANSYTGTTTVTAGTLRLKYAVASASAATPVLTTGGADVQNGKLVFDYTGSSSPAGVIRSLLAGGALRSSTATFTRGLGYRDDNAGNLTVQPALYGDADLDGGVSINDFNLLAANFGQSTGKHWFDGDFDYDAGVSINDFNRLAGAFGQSLPASADTWAGLLAFAAAHDDLAAFEAVTGVPEPAMLTVAASLLMMAGCRRRRID